MAETITALPDPLIAAFRKEKLVLLATIDAETDGRAVSDEVPFSLFCIDVTVQHVQGAIFYGACISAEPEYEKTYDFRAAKTLHGQVFSAMKKA